MDNSKLPSYMEFIIERQEYDFEYFAESVGTGFLFGTMGGSFRHFFKGFTHKSNRGQSIRTKFGGGINAMRFNSVRAGGFFACLILAIDIPSYVFYQYRGEKTVWTDKAISLAAAGAIMWAPRGLRSASLAALTFGGIYTVNQGIKIALKNVKPRKNVERNHHSVPILAMVTIWDSLASWNRSRDRAGHGTN